MSTKATQSALVPLPTAQSVAFILTGLLGKRVTARPLAATLLGPPAPAVIALYACDDGSPGALAVSDLGFACHAGAALSLIPAAMAAESVAAGCVAEVILDNLHEVFNVCAKLFNRTGSRHLVLRDLYAGWPSTPGLVVALLNHATAQLDLEVTIPEYGTGKLAIVTV